MNRFDDHLDQLFWLGILHDEGTNFIHHGQLPFLPLDFPIEAKQLCGWIIPFFYRWFEKSEVEILGHTVYVLLGRLNNVINLFL